MTDANDVLGQIANMLQGLSTVKAPEVKSNEDDITLSYCGQPITVTNQDEEGRSFGEICREYWQDLGFGGPADVDRMTIRDDDGTEEAVDKFGEPELGHSYTITVPRETKGSN